MRCAPRSTAPRPKAVPDCHGLQGWQGLLQAGQAEDHRQVPVIGNPADGYYALKATAESKGAMDAVTDEEVVEGSRCWRRPKAFCRDGGRRDDRGVVQTRQAGLIKKNDVTVAYITGNGLKTQEAVVDAVGRLFRIQPSLVNFQKHSKWERTVVVNHD